jgi:hypothetical protein
MDLALAQSPSHTERPAPIVPGLLAASSAL